MILSLQGCVAVGKTTAVRYLQENAPYIHISYEDNRDVIEEIRRRKLDKNKYKNQPKFSSYALKYLWKSNNRFHRTMPRELRHVL